MTEKPSPEEVVRWQHRLAGQANNRAWSLSEQVSRSRPKTKRCSTQPTQPCTSGASLAMPTTRHMPSQQMLHLQAAIPKITSATIKKLRVSQPRLKTQRSSNHRSNSPGSSRTDECVYECRLAVRSTALSSRGSFNSGSTNDLKAMHGDF